MQSRSNLERYEYAVERAGSPENFQETSGSLARSFSDEAIKRC
ncbi:hypothetical protein [Baaleninema sp.]